MNEEQHLPNFLMNFEGKTKGYIYLNYEYSEPWGTVFVVCIENAIFMALLDSTDADLILDILASPVKGSSKRFNSESDRLYFFDKSDRIGLVVVEMLYRDKLNKTGIRGVKVHSIDLNNSMVDQLMEALLLV